MNSVERVKAICAERKIAISKLEKDLHFGNGYIGQLRKGTFPADRLAKIADYLDVTTDYLLTGKEKAPADSGERSSDIDLEKVKIALFGGDVDVTDEMWDEAVFAAQLIKERHKRKKD